MTSEPRIEGVPASVVPLHEELARVALRNDKPTRDGRRVPAGSTGTIVDVLARGQAYIVEFVLPFPALVTVGAVELVTLQDR